MFVAQSVPLANWTQTLKDVGLVGVLVLFIAALYLQKVVWYWQYSALERDRDFWRQKWFEGHETTRQAIGATKTLAEKL